MIAGELQKIILKSASLVSVYSAPIVKPLQSSSRPSFSRFMAALTHARWLKACGVLPICSPEMATSSENMPKWFE